MPIVVMSVFHYLAVKSKLQLDLIRISPDFNRKSDDLTNLGFFSFWT